MWYTKPGIIHFNPLSPHGERHSSRIWTAKHKKFQSTLPAWGETMKGWLNKMTTVISIHSPRMGRDSDGRFMRASEWRFQSTLPAWGETNDPNYKPFTEEISIHSPRMGRDLIMRLQKGLHLFQSTLPAWGETSPNMYASCIIRISIHSPRMGRDDSIPVFFRLFEHFNPLSPHGERPTHGRSCKTS